MRIFMHWVVIVTILSVLSRTTFGGESGESHKERRLTDDASEVEESLSDVCLVTAVPRSRHYFKTMFITSVDYGHSKYLKRLFTGDESRALDTIWGQGCVDRKCLWYHGGVHYWQAKTLIRSLKYTCPLGSMKEDGQEWFINSFSVRWLLANDAREFSDNACIAGVSGTRNVVAFDGLYVRYYGAAERRLTNTRNPGYHFESNGDNWFATGGGETHYLASDKSEDCLVDAELTSDFDIYDYRMKNKAAREASNKISIYGRGHGVYTKLKAEDIWFKNKGNYIVAMSSYGKRGPKIPFRVFVILNGIYQGIIWTPPMVDEVNPKRGSPIIWNSNHRHWNHTRSYMY